MPKLIEKLEIIYSDYLVKKRDKYQKQNDKYKDKLDWLWQVVKQEKHFNIPFKTRLRMYKNGFSSDDYIKYDFEQNDMDDYISEMERWQSRRINKEYNVVLDDKQLFYYVFKDNVNTPKIIGTVKSGRIIDSNNHVMTIKEIKEYLYDNSGLVFRLNRRGGGLGLFILKYRNGLFFLNDEVVGFKDIKKIIKSIDEYIVSEAIENHPYSDKIFSKSVNTIRLIIGKNKDESEYKALAAFHRFGCNESIPGDNVSRGGLIAPIDMNTGIIGKATRKKEKKNYSKHPDTKEQIAGVKIPHFEKMVKELVNLSYKYPFLNFVAWDVVITKTGFIIIEGNASTDINMIQYFGGVRKKSLGKLFESYGIKRK